VSIKNYGLKLMIASFMNLMKNYIAVIITIVFLICPSICFSSYTIELKNGSKFITYQYWKEGSQINFGVLYKDSKGMYVLYPRYLKEI